MKRALVVVAALAALPACRLLGLFPDAPCEPGQGRAQCPSGVCGRDGACLSPDEVAAACGGPGVLRQTFDDAATTARTFRVQDGTAFDDGRLVLPAADEQYGDVVAHFTVDLRAGAVVLDVDETPSSGDGTIWLQVPWRSGRDGIALRGTAGAAAAFVSVDGDEVASGRVEEVGPRWRLRVQEDVLFVEHGPRDADAYETILEAPAPPFVDALELVLSSYAQEGRFVVDALNVETPVELPFCPASTVADETAAGEAFWTEDDADCDVALGGARAEIAVRETDYRTCAASTKRFYDLADGAFSVQADDVDLGTDGWFLLAARTIDAGDEVAIVLDVDDEELRCRVVRVYDEEQVLTSAAAGARGLRIRVADGRVHCDARVGPDDEWQERHDLALPFPLDAARASFGVGGPGPVSATFTAFRGE